MDGKLYILIFMRTGSRIAEEKQLLCLKKKRCVWGVGKNVI